MQTALIIMFLLVCLGGAAWGISQFVPGRAPSAPQEPPSTKEGQEITEAELAALNLTYACPDCKGTLLEGPEGGLCVNMLCSDCGAKFNVMYNMQLGPSTLPVFGAAQRLNDRQHPPLT